MAPQSPPQQMFSTPSIDRQSPFSMAVQPSHGGEVIK
jgi:hypothetical protein